MTNQQKLVAVLSEIEKTMEKEKESHSNFGYDWYSFNGKIGADVTFTGDRVCPRGDSDYQSYTNIDLKSNGANLGLIRTDNGFDIKNSKKIEVVSSAWKERDGVITRTETKEETWKRTNGVMTVANEKVNELKVYHTPDETPDAVISRIYGTMTLSKAKMQAAEKPTKFSKLNIATKVDLTKDSVREM